MNEFGNKADVAYLWFLMAPTIKNFKVPVVIGNKVGRARLSHIYGSNLNQVENSMCVMHVELGDSV